MTESTEQNGSGLFNMLADMAKDSTIATTFESSPADLMARYGVSQSQQDLIMEAFRDNRPVLSVTAFDEELRKYNIHPCISFTGL